MILFLYYKSMLPYGVIPPPCDTNQTVFNALVCVDLITAVTLESRLLLEDNTSCSVIASEANSCYEVLTNSHEITSSQQTLLATPPKEGVAITVRYTHKNPRLGGRGIF